MLSQYLQKSLFDLGSVDRDTRFLHLLHLLAVQLHQFDIWITLNRLQLVVNYLVMAVDTVDVSEEAVQD